MENKIKSLINRIKESDLSENDKNILIEKLNKPKPDIPGFTSSLIVILKVSKELLKLFEIDLWDD